MPDRTPDRLEGRQFEPVITPTIYSRCSAAVDSAMTFMAPAWA